MRVSDQHDPELVGLIGDSDSTSDDGPSGVQVAPDHALRDALSVDNRWVAVYVLSGETEPIIKAQALRDADGGALVELTADGEVRRSETW